MKIEYLQKIIARIQNQIHCPKCKAPFVEEAIEIQGVKGLRVEFSAECSQCASRSQISAEISGPNVQPSNRKTAEYKKHLSGFELPQKSLKRADLKPLKDTLKFFKGEDIRGLFKN